MSICQYTYIQFYVGFHFRNRYVHVALCGFSIVLQNEYLQDYM